MKSSPTKPCKHVILTLKAIENNPQCCLDICKASMIVIIIICLLQTTQADKISGYQQDDDLLARQPTDSAGRASYTV